jgi:hypothetical protein
MFRYNLDYLCVSVVKRIFPWLVKKFPAKYQGRFLSDPFRFIRPALPSNALINIINKKFWEELIAYFALIRQGPHRKK